MLTDVWWRFVIKKEEVLEQDSGRAWMSGTPIGSYSLQHCIMPK